MLSRKAVLEIEQEAKKNETLAQLEEGRVLRGTVKNLTDYGAFVDLGGLDGLLHVTDISWGRVNHPSDVLKVGDEIDVVVLKFDRDTERVSLGTKQLTADPWEQVPEKYPVGSRVTGRVTNVTDYGAFVELEQGIEGLIHVSEMSWSKKMKNPSKVVSVGDQVEAVISDVNMDTRRISLSLKNTLPDPWEGVTEKYPVGTEITGKVRNLTDFGAFVEIEEGVDGLIHVSDMSWTKRMKHPSEVLKKGDDVRATVTHIDPENRRISLSIKEFLPNEWEDFQKKHEVGSVVEGTVTRIADFGVFVNIDGMVEGLMHVSETPLTRGQKPQEFYAEGQKVRATILRIEDEEMKVGLSSRETAEAEAPPAAEVRGGSPRAAGPRSSRSRRLRAPKKKRTRKKADSSGPNRSAMTKAELIDRVLAAANLNKKEAEAAVETFFDSIIQSLRDGEKIELRGFGSFRLRRAGRANRAEPEDGRPGERSRQKDPLFQAGKRTEGTDQSVTR